MFSFISMNWRGSHRLIAGNSQFDRGDKIQFRIKIKASIDENIYERGLKVSDEEFHKINIEKDGFHGEWNYVIKPSDE